jgi:hypothetical protein
MREKPCSLLESPVRDFIRLPKLSIATLVENHPKLIPVDVKDISARNAIADHGASASSTMSIQNRQDIGIGIV